MVWVPDGAAEGIFDTARRVRLCFPRSDLPRRRDPIQPHRSPEVEGCLSKLSAASVVHSGPCDRGLLRRRTYSRGHRLLALGLAFSGGASDKRDRREILAMFRGSTGTGLVLGVVLFYWLKWVPYEWMFVLGGVALLIPFHFSTMRHLNVVKQATVDAAKLSDAKAKENAAAAAAPEASKGLVDALKAWLAPLFK